MLELNKSEYVDKNTAGDCCNKSSNRNVSSHQSINLISEEIKCSGSCNPDYMLINEKLDYVKQQKEALSAENYNLKLELDRVKADSNKLKEFECENDKLKHELNVIRNQNALELDKINTKLEYELKIQQENFKIKTRFEENEREEMKRKYALEINAAKIRYENELTKQNSLMQAKYDSLHKEIFRLSDMVVRLQKERVDLISQIQNERNINRQLVGRQRDVSPQKIIDGG